ncbi:DUF485 domain-containing protein [Streptomyces sp. ISL-12]|uniref:DUF485 domain-containing protein n=1 Tax=Streptomyces sp. ISL-12 TaxID=2819177 RepID=UPI001BEAC083|nr:DUF485 domain-containing protein [Streptomyces sp. ISL-12]MBT2413674.1 DUF485 domain-containing protein [Streptomyces sp. ISL-12]
MQSSNDRLREAGAYDDPWYDALASGWGEVAESAGTATPVPPSPTRPAPGGGAPAAVSPTSATRATRTAEAAVTATTEAYLEVQGSAAFQEVRSRYRRFVVPAGAGFLVWYLGYLVAATTAPGLMGRPVAGAVNVAMLAGLGQFLTTFLLTWAYTRHARLRRDRAALELRWHTQERARARGGAA